MVAVLIRTFGSIDIAEDAVSEAFVAAITSWPVNGLPPSPAGWIITTARNRAIDQLRREASRDDRQAAAVRLHAGPRCSDSKNARRRRRRLAWCATNGSG